MRNAFISAAGGALLVACSGGESAEEPSSPVTQSTSETGATPAPASAPNERSAEFAALPAPYNEASYSVGRRTFRLCSSCHLLEEGAGHLVGPNLAGLFGRTVGSAEGFSYSPALQEAEFVWTPEQLDAWLADPNGFLRGNRMSFAGVRGPADRAAVIAYIMTETGYTGVGE